MDVYKQVLRPLLFQLDAETAHNLVRALLKRPLSGRLFGGKTRYEADERLRVSMGGLIIANPVGLSAGFDKDCDMINSLMCLGFGYIVSGSVMVRQRSGNPRPRMIRDPGREGLYSCMGLPSRGLDYAVRHLKKHRSGSVPLIVNLNAEVFDEYLEAFDALQPLGDMLEVTLFCPNRPQDSGDFLSPGVCGRLLAEIVKRKKKPLFIKIPGYRNEEDRLKRLDLVEHIIQYPVDGITITPESLVEDKRLSIGRGTITGRPTFAQVLEVVRDVYRITKKHYHIKASGGIFSAKDAFEVISAGASSVEIYTGFIYEGWDIAKKINRGLIDLLDKHHIENIEALRGSPKK